MDYLDLKSLHMGAAALSVTGFALRGAGACLDARWIEARAVRVLPHGVDTVLLGTAIALAVQAGVAPWSQGWLGVKVAGLLVYIGLGTLVMRRRLARPARVLAWLAALAVFAGIVATAIYKPWP